MWAVHLTPVWMVLGKRTRSDLIHASPSWQGSFLRSLLDAYPMSMLPVPPSNPLGSLAVSPSD